MTKQIHNQAHYDRMEHPKTVAPDDYWGQVRRTIHGKPFSDDQIALLRNTIRNALQFTQQDILLDICCGNGALTASFFDELRGYLGVDMSPVLIEIAQRDFQRTGSHEYVLGVATDFLAKVNEPKKFSLCMWVIPPEKSSVYK